MSITHGYNRVRMNVSPVPMELPGSYVASQPRILTMVAGPESGNGLFGLGEIDPLWAPQHILPDVKLPDIRQARAYAEQIITGTYRGPMGDIQRGMPMDRSEIIDVVASYEFLLNLYMKCVTWYMGTKLTLARILRANPAAYEEIFQGLQANMTLEMESFIAHLNNLLFKTDSIGVNLNALHSAAVGVLSRQGVRIRSRRFRGMDSHGELQYMNFDLLPVQAGSSFLDLDYASSPIKDDMAHMAEYVPIVARVAGLSDLERDRAEAEADAILSVLVDTAFGNIGAAGPRAGIGRAIGRFLTNLWKRADKSKVFAGALKALGRTSRITAWIAGGALVIGSAMVAAITLVKLPGITLDLLNSAKGVAEGTKNAMDGARDDARSIGKIVAWGLGGTLVLAGVAFVSKMFSD